MTIKQPGVIAAMKLLTDHHVRVICGPSSQLNNYLWSYISQEVFRKVNDDVRSSVGTRVATYISDEWVAEEFLRESPGR